MTFVLGSMDPSLHYMIRTGGLPLEELRKRDPKKEEKAQDLLQKFRDGQYADSVDELVTAINEAATISPRGAIDLATGIEQMPDDYKQGKDILIALVKSQAFVNNVRMGVAFNDYKLTEAFVTIAKSLASNVIDLEAIRKVLSLEETASVPQQLDSLSKVLAGGNNHDHLTKALIDRVIKMGSI